MQFKSDRPIYLQIVDALHDRVLSGDLASEERAPAVRELAVQLQVNPNTVVKSFTALEEEGVIYKKRGLGYFIAPEARARILDVRRHEFMQVSLPQFIRSMKLLGVTLDDFRKEHEKQEINQ